MKPTSLHSTQTQHVINKKKNLTYLRNNNKDIEKGKKKEYCIFWLG